MADVHELLLLLLRLDVQIVQICFNFALSLTMFFDTKYAWFLWTFCEHLIKSSLKNSAKWLILKGRRGSPFESGNPDNL